MRDLTEAPPKRVRERGQYDNVVCLVIRGTRDYRDKRRA